MKSFCRSFLYILTIASFITACNKKEPAILPTSVIKMIFKGYSFNDTLEVVQHNVVLATLRANSSFEAMSLIAIKNANEEIGLRKKGTSEIISTITVPPTPFMQTKKIFFDGKTVQDKIEVTPVKQPGNIGFRIWFKTDFPYFYGGPVDFVISKLSYDNSTYDFSFTPVTTIKNVGDTFSEFIELPRLTSTEQETNQYVLRIFKAGTTELPYKEGVDLSGIADFQFYYCIIDGLKAGQSGLFKVGPYYSEKTLGESFQMEDIAFPFR